MPVETISLDEKNQQWLDQNQYSRKGILRYEAIFGRTFVSVGGEETTRQFVSQLGLKPGMKVLDIACGTGGSSFYMARTYGVDVHGVDLASNMIGIAQDYRAEMEAAVKHRVQFYIEDATTMEYPHNFYDVVYSRDAIMHMEKDKKEQLYRKFLSTLKPGGKLMISDYCRGDQEHSQRFLDYVVERGYKLYTVKEYGTVLEKAGFQNVAPMDKTELMIDIMTTEVEKFKAIKETFISEFSKEDFDWILEVFLKQVFQKGKNHKFSGLDKEGGEVQGRGPGRCKTTCCSDNIFFFLGLGLDDCHKMTKQSTLCAIFVSKKIK